MDSVLKRAIVRETDIDYLGKRANAEIYIKRDDLLGFSFGGNKVRIAAEIFEEIRRGGYTAVVSYGSYASNLNRVIAHMAGYYGIKVYIVCKQEEHFQVTANMKLAEYSGAEYYYCTPDKVRETVDKVLHISMERGEKPYYVYGNSLGEGNEAVLLEAYRKAYAEISAFSEEKGIAFSNIFLACGTGMTQSGLIAGKLQKGGTESICGISVARNADSARAVIEKNLTKCGFLDNNRENAEKTEDLIRVEDAYLKGGYGHYDEAVEAVVRRAVSEYGIALDPVYTGKAFYGMLSEIDKRELEGNILFIHTGGMPGFFDNLFRK